ncbi:O-antigen flippase Wzx [Geofilum rubicundum JCM 15548]|uniref:O-antigen flippase Wzx n=1 Tax=Geofilum rubicundum JCM 15548 TaxID=1236989 RepID=A0A0E9M2P4_9BACT|nr:O-antigen flippase Wzx [Geofilum rubicundum JCM 15548]
MYSFGLQGVTIVIGFVYVPLLLDYLDNERYGIWLTLTSILGWFEFFNVGLGSGLRNKFAEAVAQDKHELARVYVSTTYAIVIAIFFAVILLFYVLNPFLQWDAILNTRTVPAQELSILALIVFSFFSLRFILKLVGVILIADQRPAVYNAFMPIGNVITLIIIILLIHFSEDGSLIVLGFVLSAVPAMVLLVMTFVLFNGRYRKYRPSLKLVNLKLSGDLMKLGRKFFIIQISAIVLFMTSNIIIIQLLGPEEVTIYNIAYKYFSIPIMVFAIIMTPIWSAVTEAYVKKDISWLKRTLQRLNLASGIFVVGIFLMLLLSEMVYELWIGDRVSIPFLLSLSMAFFAIINVVLSPYTQFINGFGKLKLTIIVVVVQTTLFIPLAVLLVKSSLGVSGVVLAICLINAMGFLYVPLQTYKILNNKAKGIWGQ